MYETRYYTPMDLLLNFGAFKSILDIFIGLVAGMFIYKSYSTYVSREIQRELQIKQAEEV